MLSLLDVHASTVPSAVICCKEVGTELLEVIKLDVSTERDVFLLSMIFILFGCSDDALKKLLTFDICFPVLKIEADGGIVLAKRLFTAFSAFLFFFLPLASKKKPALISTRANPATVIVLVAGVI